MKKCTRCKKEKALNEFYKRTYKTGTVSTKSWCKECEKLAYRTGDDAKKHQCEIQSRFRERHIEKLKLKEWQWRLDTLNAYGGKCDCCGEERPEFLALDHINGGGGKERRNGITGITLMRKLKKEGYPKGIFRVLCHNCNLSLGFYGYCPHQHKDESFLDLAIKYRMQPCSRRD
jgi:hypothetical protein